MKYLYLLFVSVPLLSLAQQRGQFGAYFMTDMPNRAMMPKMSTNAGVGLLGSYKPLAYFPLSLELKGSLGSYCSRTIPQTYMFNDSTGMTTDVTYASNMNKIMLGTRFTIGSDFRVVRGFITPQIGRAKMKTRISIADPEDEDGCEPLEKETTHRYSGWIYGAEIGADISMSRLFRGIESENKHRLYVSVNYLGSFGKFSYANVRYMRDHDHHMNSGEDMDLDDADRDINGQFINLSTNSIHEHKIGELYSTYLQMWGFNIGWTYNF